jgi:hypothetical protein
MRTLVFNRHVTGHALSILVGLLFAMAFFIIFPIVSQTATSLGGWDSEWMIGQSGATASSLLISTGTDTSKVIEVNPYVANPGLEDLTDPAGGSQDIAPPTGQPGWTDDVGTLTTHPFYPLVKAISDLTTIPQAQIWVIGAIFIIMAATIAGYVWAPHQLLTAGIGTLLMIAFIIQTILPWWTIFVYILIAVAILLMERNPVVA